MRKENVVSFGPRLKAERKQAGYSLKQLAEKAEFSASYLSLLENNKRQPSFKAVKQLVTILELSLEDSQALRLAAGFQATAKDSPHQVRVHLPLSFLHFLLKLYATTIQADSLSAQSLIMNAFGVYQHPVCLQILLAFLEAVRLQVALSQQALGLAKQAYLIQTDAFDKSVWVYAELLLQMVNPAALNQTQLESMLKQVDSLPSSPEKNCLQIFVYALQPTTLDPLAKLGEKLLFAEVPDALILTKQAALLLWLKALKSSQKYQLLYQKSLAALRTFAAEHPLLLPLSASESKNS